MLHNKTPLPPDLPTFASELRAAGYHTAYFGKWHMGRQRERPGFDFSASYLAQGGPVDVAFDVNGVSVATQGWVDEAATVAALRAELMERERSIGSRPPGFE